MAKWKKTFEQRFWEKVDRRGPNECWPWIGAAYEQQGSRRGQIWDSERVIPAPVAALKIAGRYVNGLHGLHRCNNTICVNERHLYCGTQVDNMRDAIVTGTHVGYPKGEIHPSAKLTVDDVIKIRGIRASMQSIADMFGVSKKVIWNIVNRKSWAHVG